MSFGALSAVGACVQIVKTLYEYYNVHTRNKALLDILEGFSQNLEISIERLQAREGLFGLGENDALTFASKMSVAIFSALQDTRHGIIKLQTSVDGLPTNIGAVCRAATKESIQEAIVELKKEAYEAVGGGDGREKGFRNGEAEKIISQLVDQLSEQERIKEDEELLAASGYAPLLPARASSGPAIPYTPAAASGSASRRNSYMPSASHDHDTLDPFEPATTATDNSSLFSRKRSVATSMTSAPSLGPEDGNESSVDRKGRRREKKEKIPQGAIIFNPRDPYSNAELCDPVLANDGLIHDRWTLVEGDHQNLRDPNEPLVIVGDVVQLREAIFTSFPERRSEFQARRQEYRETTIQLYDSSSYTDLPDIVNRLSHVLLYDSTSVSLRIRRGIALYRLRRLSEALDDLNCAIETSTRSIDGEPDQHDPDVDGLRVRALICEELHENTAALRDVEAALSQAPYDVLSLSLRAIIRSNAGDTSGAQSDLAATNQAIRNGKAYRSRLGDADCDLEFLARGWAYCGIRDFASAAADFAFSASLRDPPEPYALACRGLAKIKTEEASGALSAETLEDGLADLDEGVELLRKLAVAEGKTSCAPRRYTSGAARLTVGEDGLPTAAYSCLLLRGAARHLQGEYELALHDFSIAFRLRPPQVRDVGAVRCAVAELKAECGDRDGAQRDFDMALALVEPAQRFAVVSAREEHGL
ncbi:hypothetical protein JCM10213v2_007117 [Rhodosporidiobolus nylandii]